MSALKLHGVDEKAPPTPNAGGAGDPVASWLDVLEKLLGGSAEEVRGIREELASHLRERVRDLTVSGVTEAEAVRTAIGELGDAAELARRFQQAKGSSKRRTVMQIALASAAVIVLGAGGLAVRGSVQADKAQREAAVAREHALAAKNEALTAFTAAVLAQEGVATADRDAAVPTDAMRPLLADATVVQRRAALASVLTALSVDGAEDVVVSCGAKDTWQQFFDSAARAAGKGSHTNFTSLDGTGIDGTSVIGVEISGMKLGEAVRFLNEGVPGLSGDVRLAFRASGAVLEFASEKYFDRREQETRTYDLDVLVQDLLAKEAAHPGSGEEKRHSRLTAEETVCDQVSVLVQDMVQQTMWAGNGGDLGSIRRFGSKLFVTAPVRHFKDIEWVLKEVGAFEQPRAMSPSGGVKHPVTVAVDGASGRLMLSDSGGATLLCDSLRLEAPEALAEVVAGGVVQRSLPILSDIPLVEAGVVRRAGHLMADGQLRLYDSTLVIERAAESGGE